MADFTPSGIAARQAAESAALKKAFQRISDCDLFRDALAAFEDASAGLRACTDESQPQREAAEVLDGMMTAMVYAVADYHCARVVFDVTGALQALDGKDIA